MCHNLEFVGDRDGKLQQTSQGSGCKQIRADNLQEAFCDGVINFKIIVLKNRHA